MGGAGGGGRYTSIEVRETNPLVASGHVPKPLLIFLFLIIVLWLCKNVCILGKYTLKNLGVKGYAMHNSLSNGLEKSSREREKRNGEVSGGDVTRGQIWVKGE